jgi:hypothetical protein
MIENEGEKGIHEKAILTEQKYNKINLLFFNYI